jgi:hypothetical protein
MEQNILVVFFSCRELFHDWEHQDLLDLEILRIGCEKSPRPPINPNDVVKMMQKIGRIARNQVHFWNAFNTITLETYGQIPGGISEQLGRDTSFMPISDMNSPNALGLATGGGQSTNLYAGGVYQLDDNEALLVKKFVPIEPQFMGFHLSNQWGESLDFESYQSSLNAAQMQRDTDGGCRLVVCRHNPGIANWVDTTGLPHGYLTIRWTYSRQPPKKQWPSLNVGKIRFGEIEEKFTQVHRISAEELQAKILTRHIHVQRRYRQY